MENSLKVIRERGSLNRFKRALKSGRVTVGFIGGSITEANTIGNWPWHVGSYLMRKYPDVKFCMENAGIGGTGSLSGVMRAEDELIKTDCDVVFIEYAVNDSAGEETMRTREGLIRKLLEQERDIILVYTYKQEMYDDMNAGKVPQSIVELEILGELYKLPSIWMGLHAFNEQKNGRMRWEMWIPDGTHPTPFGSAIYAEAIERYLEKELSSQENNQIPYGDNLPAPHNVKNFQHITTIPKENIFYTGAWCEMRETISPWYKSALYTSADGASLTFEFEGRALCAMLGFGKHSSKIIYRIDSGEWQEFLGERFWWVPENNWTRPVLFFDDLADGKHVFEMVSRHGNAEECKGTTCKIFTFMTVK